MYTTVQSFTHNRNAIAITVAKRLHQSHCNAIAKRRKYLKTKDLRHKKRFSGFSACKCRSTLYNGSMTSENDKNGREKMSNTYTGRVYDTYGEIIDETEGHSVEGVEQDILDKWTGCVEAKAYAVLNDDDGSEEAVEEFPSVRLNKMWSQYNEF